MVRALVVTCLLLSGCSAGPESFWRGVTRSLCKYNRKCAGSEERVSECAPRLYSQSESPVEFAANCPDFDRAAARECLRYVREAQRQCIEPSINPTACEGVCGPGTGIVFSPESAVIIPAEPVGDEPLVPILIAD